MVRPGRLLELFEIEHPIVLAPMAGFGTVEVAAAVGGFRRPRLDRLRNDETRSSPSRPIARLAASDRQVQSTSISSVMIRRKRMPTVSVPGMTGCAAIIASLELMREQSASTCRPRAVWRCHVRGSSRTPGPRW